MSNKKVAKPIELEDTGERLIPSLHSDKIIYGEHMGRYTSIINSVKKKTVLDIACGTGYGSQFIAKHAAHVYGVDISEEAIKYAEKNYPAKNLTYKVGDGNQIPLKDGVVDAVVSMETIEHIEDQETFLSEVKRVLKPGGNFYVSTPNDKEYPKGNHFHVREHNPRSLEKLLKKYFKNVQLYYQVDEIAASIVSGKRLGEPFEVDSWSVHKTIPLEPMKCIYFLAACSDGEPGVIEENTFLAEHYSYHEVARQWNRERELWLYTQDLEPKLKEAEIEREHYKAQYEAIVASKTYRISRKLGDMKAKVNRLRK